MAITLGTFTKLDDGIFSGTLKTLNVTAALTVVPGDKMSDNAPDYRVYAGQRYEIGAGWSQVAKSSGETYLNLKIGAPESGPSWVRCRLVKLVPPPRRRHPHRPVGAARPLTATPRRGFSRRGSTLAFRGELGPKPIGSGLRPLPPRPDSRMSGARLAVRRRHSGSGAAAVRIIP